MTELGADTPSGATGRDRWLTKGTRGIGGASLLADVGHEIPTSLLPSLLTSTLGAPASALGLIEGVSDGLAGAAKLGGGALADDPHRRRQVAIGGYSATAILSILIGVAGAVWQVAILRAGAWTARGLRVPARNALLADIVPADVYGRAYGFERAMDNLGAILGPLLGIALVALAGVRGAILLSVIPGLLAGAGAFLAAYVMLALTGPSLAPLALAFVFAGIGIGCAETAEHAAVAAHAPAELRGSAFGLLATLQSLGNFAASVTAGLLWSAISPAAAFAFAATAMLIALIALTPAARPG